MSGIGDDPDPDFAAQIDFGSAVMELLHGWYGYDADLSEVVRCLLHWMDHNFIKHEGSQILRGIDAYITDVETPSRAANG